MPIGCSAAISTVITKAVELQPASVLDVGVGFGLNGMLFRQYLDVKKERYEPETWQVKIDGLEIWEPYITDVHRYLYDQIIIGDVRDVQIGDYDLIFAGDIIEHLAHEEGERVIANLMAHSKNLIVVMPAGFYNPSRDPFGNPHEHHQAEWTPAELEALGATMLCTYPMIAWFSRKS